MTYPDDGLGELPHTQLLHGLDVGGVGLDDVGPAAGEVLHPLGVVVDGELLDVVALELVGE